MPVTRAGVYHYGRGAFTDGRGRKAGKRDDPEARLQRDVLEYLTFALPRGVYRVRAGMEGARRSQWEGGKAKGQGLSKGWPDLMLFNRQTRAIRWIELKSDTGALTAEQKELAAELRDHMVVCRSLEDVEAALIGWGVTPRCPINVANRYSGGVEQPTDLAEGSRRDER